MMKEAEFRTVRLHKTLGNPLRQKILRALAASPARPHELARRAKRPLPAVSRALGILAASDLVSYRTEGHGVLYFLKHVEILPLLRFAETFVRRAARPAAVHEQTDSPPRRTAGDAAASSLESPAPDCYDPASPSGSEPHRNVHPAGEDPMRALAAPMLAAVVLAGPARADEAAAPAYDQAGVPLEVDTDDASLTKIVLVAGTQSHAPGDHEHFAGMALLMKMLKQTPKVFPVMARDGWPKNETIFENAKSIAFFSDGRTRHPLRQPGRMDLLQKHIDRGAGYVNIHYAVDYVREDGDRILGWLGGYYDAAVSTNPHWTAEFKAIPEHPVTRGVRPFALRDEWYYNMRWNEGMKGVTPLLRAVPPDATRRTADAKKHPGRAEIVAWAFERPDGGRSFGFTGGHSQRNWANPDFRRIVVNALLWSAKIEIPPDGAPCELNPADLMKHLDTKKSRNKKKK